VKISLTTTEISRSKTQNDQNAKINKLTIDLRSIKCEKAKLLSLVAALMTKKENVLKKLDESVPLKLKSNEICAGLALEKERVSSQRTIEATSPNGNKNQETTLQHKQESSMPS
jgi:hypothetical protein